MEYSKSDENSLAGVAQEILREISSRTPEVLKAHVQEICRSLQENAPSSKKSNDFGALDNLKACASFATRYPKEVPKDRKFVQAMTSYALFGSPPEAAKYAVSVSWAASDKKELLAKDLVQKCIKDFQYGGDGFLSRLATLSQLVLLAPEEVDDDSDAITAIAIKQVLLRARVSPEQPREAYEWSDTVDTDCLAKCWALKILTNRTRSHPTPETLSEVVTPVYSLLSTLVKTEGKLPSVSHTPPTHRPRLRLLAARSYLKLCTKKSLDGFLTADAFNSMALVAQDGEQPVRAGFMRRLKKYLGQQKLPQRFYTIPFLLAFEPSDELKGDTVTWIKSRAITLANLKAQQSGTTRASIVLESVFARLLSLLAHHPDYDSDARDLVDFARYIVFYLQSVATEENLSLIYHIAQRVKQCRDAVLPANAESAPVIDDHLYHLSDLAQLAIRKFEDLHNWTIQTLPAKVRLPGTLFSEVKSHNDAQRIAEKSYLPEGVEQGVEDLVRASMRTGRPGHGKKRKSEGDDLDGRDHKKAKGLPIRKPEKKKDRKSAAAKTPKSKTAKPREEEVSAEKRRSGRAKVFETSYVERDSEEDDEEMELMDVYEAKQEEGADQEADNHDAPLDEVDQMSITEEGRDQPQDEQEMEMEMETEAEAEAEEQEIRNDELSSSSAPSPPPPVKPSPKSQRKKKKKKENAHAPSPKAKPQQQQGKKKARVRGHQKSQPVAAAASKSRRKHATATRNGNVGRRHHDGDVFDVPTSPD